MPSSTKESSPSLVELQSWLRWIFTEPSGPKAALDGRKARLSRGPEPRPRLLNWIADSPPMGALPRLAVYSDAYFLRLMDSLASDYPVVRRALGDSAFQELVAEYLAANPSTSPNIGDAGRALPQFIGTHHLGRRLPFLPDLARLEWELLLCLHADRLPPLDVQTLAGVPPEAWSRATVTLDPTVRPLKLGWPVDRLWRRRGGRALRQPRRTCLVLYRDEDWVQVRLISSSEHQTLVRLKEGAPLGEVCAALEKSTRGKNSAKALQALFQGWVTQGILRQIHVAGS